MRSVAVLMPLVCVALGAGTDAHAEAANTVPILSSCRNVRTLSGIPEADEMAMRRIADARHWPNPYVMVSVDGYELMFPDVKRSATRISLAELEATLLKLPVRRWRLGRVAAVQENGVMSPGQEARLSERSTALERMLACHGIRADLWPSA